MNERERRLVAACADAMFPSGGPIPISGTDAGLVVYFDGYLNGLSRIKRMLFRLLFLFIQLSPFVFGPRRACFTRLSPDQRVIVLKRMEKTDMYFRRVGIFQPLRLILTAGYFAHPPVDAIITGKQRGGRAT